MFYTAQLHDFILFLTRTKESNLVAVVYVVNVNAFHGNHWVHYLLVQKVVEQYHAYHIGLHG